MLLFCSFGICHRVSAYFLPGSIRALLFNRSACVRIIRFQRPHAPTTINGTLALQTRAPQRLADWPLAARSHKKGPVGIMR